ncbi:MAG TPA: DUF58 domain-containing protein [Trueperaceae bacterium]
MIDPRTRTLLDRYALASRALSRESGERLATEAGQSVEFHDFRPYQTGDELRYVDWRTYARTGRLYTRLYQAERSIAVHIVLDTSLSMSLGAKAVFARRLAALLAYVAQRDARAQIHLFGGSHSRPAIGRTTIADTWDFIEAATPNGNGTLPPAQALKRFALDTRFHEGSALAIIISDLFDEAPLQPALAALKARGLDASFLQLLDVRDLEPADGQLELQDLETGERLEVGPLEVRAYRQAVRDFIARTRATILQAGFRHLLLNTTDTDTDLERSAFAELVRAGVLQKR